MKNVQKKFQPDTAGYCPVCATTPGESCTYASPAGSRHAGTTRPVPHSVRLPMSASPAWDPDVGWVQG